MAVTLTETAADRVKQFLRRQGTGIGLRVGVKKTGCSGFAYVVDLAQSVGETDVVYESNGVKVIIDRDSLPIVDGTRIDFARNGLTESFQYDNPNVQIECGCGESFGV